MGGGAQRAVTLGRTVAGVCVGGPSVLSLWAGLLSLCLALLCVTGLFPLLLLVPATPDE